MHETPIKVEVSALVMSPTYVADNIDNELRLTHSSKTMYKHISSIHPPTHHVTLSSKSCSTSYLFRYPRLSVCLTKAIEEGESDL
jgi:hypothetical protein